MHPDILRAVQLSYQYFKKYIQRIVSQVSLI